MKSPKRLRELEKAWKQALLDKDTKKIMELQVEILEYQNVIWDKSFWKLKVHESISAIAVGWNQFIKRTQSWTPEN